MITVKVKQNNESTLGGRLRSTRQRMMYTIEQAAELLDISVVYLGAIERDKRCPSLKLLIDMCLSYDASSDYLLFGRNCSHAGNLTENNNRQYYLPHKLNDEQFETIMKIAAITSYKNFEGYKLDFLLSQFTLSADFISKRQNIIKESPNE